MMKIAIIAGEASGDNLGAKLMHALKEQTTDSIEFIGIGGPKMIRQGFTSLFDMHHLSLMGFAEIVPHIPKLLGYINQTVSFLLEQQPDILITIDSPGFTTAVAKKLRKANCTFTLVHYVAPTVWAYKPRRAKKFAKLFDHLMVLFPFEPPYFEKEGLTTTFVGHPLFEDDLPPAAPEFLDQHHIPNNATILLAMPGSRVNEINRHMPIYKETFHALKASIPTLHVMIPTFEHLQNTISGHIDTSLDYIHITTNKEQAIAHAHAGLIKSGTSSLEVAKNNIPMVVAYKVSYVSYLIIKQLVKVKYASIVNIVANKEIIPEFLQYDCTSDNLANALTPLLTDEQAQNSQRQALRATLDTLKTKQLPSTEAASTILRLIDTK